MTSPSLTASKNASSLESLLRPAHFVSELRSRKKSQALDELAVALAAAGVTRSPELLAELLREREALGSTGVGKGIAVPHARSTLVAREDQANHSGSRSSLPGPRQRLGRARPGCKAFPVP